MEEEVKHHTEDIFTYTLPPITGFITLYVEKENPNARFHAIQSIIFGVLFLGSYILLSMFLPYFIQHIVLTIVKTGFFGVWLYLLFRSYKNEYFELPYIGSLAKKALANTPQYPNTVIDIKPKTAPEEKQTF